MDRPTSLTSSARWLAAVAALGLAAACSSVEAPPAPEPAEPDFVVHDNLLTGQVSTRSLARMTPVDSPDGQRFYLFTPPCCDQFNKLYDANGHYVCAPSGGFTGGGDGRCPAWVQHARWAMPPDLPGSNPSRAASAV